ncbi:DEAD/DEAH box helicase [Sphingomonas sp. Leaf231]|uniref:DEAD/DEAH box helicase n=1 Tax=Sphingomonas sp. Leaf231 TaxID=1736301 RepID=UPI0006F2C857|nr:DEAD/DEAH box helicase [Sphingomonas sp. Leaf231]KQN91162.1 DEAD/DEAH box helicase [Sphingomonas sp. Leaf231]
MSFADLGLSDELLRAVGDTGYTEPTPIQASAIPPVLMMRDIIGVAQTGTGKTASFVLPMIDILAQGRSRARMPRSLILEPTRELAAQVAENFEIYGKYHKLSMALLIGGVQMGDQVKALEKGVDVLIATPGRLMDLFGRGKILLTGCSMLVIDEADRMLDMGFIPDIEEICTKLPAQRQTLLFSATMPAPIKKLADRFLTNPKTIEVARPATTNTNITQWVVPVKGPSFEKRKMLRTLLAREDVRNAIVFCNRKTTVRELNKSLKEHGISSGEIHGDMDQPARVAELEKFKRGEVDILVASDVAARGLDVKGVSHVFNYDAPWHPDDYVHRIGRTGRGGATGIAYTFVGPDDVENIENIEKLTGQKIPRIEALPEAAAVVAETPRGERPRREKRRERVVDEQPPVAAEPERRTRRVPSARAGHPAERPVEDAPRAERPVEDAPRAERPVEEAPRRERGRRERDETRGRADDRGRNDGRGRDDGRGRHEERGRDSGRDRAPAPTITAVEDGAWNGPIPEFLRVALTS